MLGAVHVDGQELGVFQVAGDGVEDVLELPLEFLFVHLVAVAAQPKVLEAAHLAVGVDDLQRRQKVSVHRQAACRGRLCGARLGPVGGRLLGSLHLWSLSDGLLGRVALLLRLLLAVMLWAPVADGGADCDGALLLEVLLEGWMGEPGRQGRPLWLLLGCVEVGLGIAGHGDVVPSGGRLEVGHTQQGRPREEAVAQLGLESQAGAHLAIHLGVGGGHQEAEHQEAAREDHVECFLLLFFLCFFSSCLSLARIVLCLFVCLT